MNTNQEYNTELDALMAAFRQAKEADGYCFVIQNKHNWTISSRKPSLRFGKIIEVRDDGGQYVA